MDFLLHQQDWSGVRSALKTIRCDPRAQTHFLENDTPAPDTTLLVTRKGMGEADVELQIKLIQTYFKLIMKLIPYLR